MIKLKELLNEIEEACWVKYKQVGMKLKDGEPVPNCVKKEGLEDTSWEDNGKKITLQQLLDVIKNYPVVQAPIEKVEKISLTPRSGGIEPDRVNNADIKYPIIIVVDDSGNYTYILDGNHRANNAIQNGSKTIPAKLVNIKKLPPEFQDVLGEALEDDDNIEEYDVESEQDIKYFVLTDKNLSPVIKRQLYNCSFRNKGLMYKMFLQHQDSATTKILSASINDKIIGWGVGFITTDVVKGNKKNNWTMMLYVFSNYRNKGIGKHILKWLKKNAPSKIDYVVYIDDTNQKFFKKTM